MVKTYRTAPVWNPSGIPVKPKKRLKRAGRSACRNAESWGNDRDRESSKALGIIHFQSALAPLLRRQGGGRIHMASASLPIDRRPARIAIVEQHVRLENEHDLEGVLGTFGDTARYDDEPWDEHYDGRIGVRLFYEQLMKALPDLVIDIQRRHITDDAIVLEVMIRGTHLGGWRGLPATGRRVEFPLCGIYTFSANDRMAGEKIYSDRGRGLR